MGGGNDHVSSEEEEEDEVEPDLESKVGKTPNPQLFAMFIIFERFQSFPTFQNVR